MDNQPKRAAIYARSAVSQEMTPSFSLTEQTKQAINYATQKGYEVVDGLIFEEVVSGNADHPPLLEKVIASAKEGNFDILIVHAYDRISRSWDRVAVVIASLNGCDVKVESITEEIPQGEQYEVYNRMIVAIHEEVAKIEREKISLRIKAGRRAKRQEEK